MSKKDKKQKNKKVKFSPENDFLNSLKDKLKNAIKLREETDGNRTTYSDLLAAKAPKDGMVIVSPAGKISFAIPMGATDDQREIFRILMSALRGNSHGTPDFDQEESNTSFEDFDKFVEKKKKDDEKPQ